MSVILFAPGDHPERMALLSALRTGTGPTLVASDLASARAGLEASPRALLVIDLRGARQAALMEARSLRRGAPETPSLALLPQEQTTSPEADTVLRAPIFLDEIVRWCARACRPPLGQAALEDLAAGLSHEISNPLTAVLLQIELLKTDPNREAVSEGLDKLKVSMQRILTVVQDVRAASERHPLRTGPKRLSELLDRTREHLEQRNPDYLPRLDVTCTAEDLQLDSQLLSAALVDVWEYLLQAGDDDSAQLHVRAHRTAQGVLRIQHIAPASRLPADAAARLFTPLWARHAIGLPQGISLTSARCAFRRHGGELLARPGEDGQLRIEALLPLDPATTNGQAAPTASPAPAENGPSERAVRMSALRRRKPAARRDGREGSP
jgi:hypothetical protein